MKEIAIAVVTLFLSWLLNKLTLIDELKKAKNEKINERRESLYAECYEILERNIMNNNAVFDHKHIEELIRIKPKMKLIASNNVLQTYKKYYEWATAIYKDYTNYCKEKDPANKYYTVTEPDGTVYEIPDFTEFDLEYFDLLTKKYIDDRRIDTRTVRSKIQDILNAMRRDLGNDTYIEDQVN